MDVIFLLIFMFFLLKGKYTWVLFGIILLTTNYLGAGTNLSNFPIRHNVSDTGLLLYLALSLRILFRTNGKLSSGPFDKYLISFYLFLLLSIFVDIFINKIDLLSIIKTSRHWLFLTCFWIFYYIPKEEIKKLLIYLLFATLFINLISITEYTFGIEILGLRKSEERLLTGMTISRGAIPSTFSIFFIFLAFLDYFELKLKWKIVIISILTAGILISMIRSLIIAVIISLALIILIKRRKTFKESLLTMSIIMAFIWIVFTSPFIKERFHQGYVDIKELDTGKRNVSGNLSFRILHIAERFKYVSQNIQRSIFGIGNITEESFPIIFKIGLRNDQGKFIQLDTADNSWGPLFLRLGFFGTFIYLSFFTKNIFHSITYTSQPVIEIAIFVYLIINLFILSFASSTMANGQFWILPAIMERYCQYED